MIGTLANTGAIIGGSLAGLWIHSRMPDRMTQIVFQILGLFTIVVGISMALRSDQMILVLVSLVVGSMLGQALDLDRFLRKTADYLQKKSRKGDSTRFTEGFVTATMMYCVGSMAILGAIQDGMGEPPELLFTKSIMDGISAIALASSFGISILFSSIPVLLYQGGITLFAGFMMQFMDEGMIAGLTSVGGILLIGLGINILKIKEIQVTNMLPSLIIIILLSYFYSF